MKAAWEKFVGKDLVDVMNSYGLVALEICR
jgi:hypothetical protein